MATANGFVDETAELEFVLTKLDGGIRCDMLGIELRHYQKKANAKAWYEDLSLKTQDCSEQAKENLKELYNGMTLRF